MVTANGLPVFLLSTWTRSSALASSASAIRKRARLRSDGVASLHWGKAEAAAVMAGSMSSGPDTEPRGTPHRCSGRQSGRRALRGLDVPAPDEVGQP